MIKDMRKICAEILKSKDACWEFLISAGINTEEDRRKHEEKEAGKKRRTKK
jgi:hypothetical protein